jgi:hypothetical protein
VVVVVVVVVVVEAASTRHQFPRGWVDVVGKGSRGSRPGGDSSPVLAAYPTRPSSVVGVTPTGSQGR